MLESGSGTRMSGFHRFLGPPVEAVESHMYVHAEGGFLEGSTGATGTLSVLFWKGMGSKAPKSLIMKQLPLVYTHKRSR